MSELELSPFQLIVIAPDEASQTFDLKLGEIILGRRDDCDIVLTHPRTQRQHAKMVVDINGLTVQGLSRRSGIEVNGNPLALEDEARVVLGDSITMGAYRLELIEKAAIPAEQQAGRQAEIEKEGGKAWQFVIQTAENETRTIAFPIPFPEAGLTVGRQADNDLVLNHPRVERKEATILQQNGAFVWQALGRRSGTLHNGNPITPDDPVRLEIGDVVECGLFKIFIEWVVSESEAEAASKAPESGGATESESESAAVPASAGGATGGRGNGNGDGPPNAFMPDYLRSAPPPPPDYSQTIPPGLERHSIRYLNYLPSIYHDDTTSRLMALFESIMVPVGWNIENFDMFLDPRTAPADFVDWLAEWFQFGFDHSWTEKKKRLVLTECHQLYARRGTRVALSRLLEIYTGHPPEIVEAEQLPFTFTVRLPFRERDVNRQMVEQIIEANKPAHTNYILDFDSRLNLDVVWSQLDFE